MNSLPTDIIRDIFSYFNTIDKIKYKQLNRTIYDCVIVDDLFDIPYKYLIPDKYRKRLTDDILCNYPYLTKLNASNNRGITDNGIKGLNLIKLNASYNSKITNVTHMQNLRELNASDNCGITDDGIKGLNLIKLDASYNSKITRYITNNAYM